MRDELMRRISDALDSDEGLAGDAELSKLLAENKPASRYARDLARMNKWLATWPSVTPADDAMEALATRIEQRLSEPLRESDDPTIAPDFDDDDALAEATRSLTRAGEPPKSKLKSAFRPTPVRVPGPRAVGAGPARSIAPAAAAAPEAPAAVAPAASLEHSPSADAPAADAPAVDAPAADAPAADAPAADAPATAAGRLSLGKLPIGKKAVLGGVHEEHAAIATDPRVDPPHLPELAQATPPVSDPGIVLSNPGVEISPDEVRALEAEAASAATAPSVRPPGPPPAPEAADRPARAKKRSSRPGAPAEAGSKAKKKRDSGERFSIPTPEPLPLGAPRLAEAPAANEAPRRNYAVWGVFAAAAVVFLGVAVSMQSGTSEPGSEARITAGVASAPAPAAASARPAAPTESARGARDEAEPEAVAAVAAALPLVPADPMPAAGPATATGTPSGAAAYAVEEPTATLAPARRGVAGDEPDDDNAALRARSARMPESGALAGARTGGVAAAAPGAVGSGAAVEDRERTEASGAGGARSDTTVTDPAPSRERPAPAAVAEPEEDDAALPAHPDRDRVQSVLSGVSDAVAACAAGEHGTASVYVVVVSSGRVTTATVSGRFAGTPIGSCIARAVRTARFPRFSEERFEVTYPYSF